MKSILSVSDRQILEMAHRDVRDKRTAYRMNCLLLLDDGYTYEEVSAILRLDDETVRRQVRAFFSTGLQEFLRSPFDGGKCKMTQEQLKKLDSFLEENFCQTTAEVVAHVQNVYAVTYTTAGMCELMKRLGFVYKKPVLIPGKVDLGRQLDFLEYYKAIKASMSANDRMYFVDGVHPQHNSMPAHGWIRKGTEKALESNTGRQRVNLNGALDADTLEVIVKAADTLNSQTTISFLKLIEEKNKDAEKIVLLVDNAPYYYNADVFEYVSNSKQLELVYLPTYAPNLNLIERLWKFMKKKTLYNRYYATFNEFKDALGNFFLRLPEYYEELSSIITEEFQIIGAV